MPNRAHFLADSLADLDAGLDDLGAKLMLRHGRVVEQVRALAAELDATEVHIAADVSAYAQRRQQALVRRCPRGRTPSSPLETMTARGRKRLPRTRIKAPRTHLMTY